MVRIVGSLTTIPSRILNPQPILLNTLKSLNDQTRKLDAIYLGIPKVSRKTGKPYPELPEEIKELCEIVELPEDYGPASKVVSALIKEQDPETRIVICDDDILYPPTLVEAMEKDTLKYPDTALCSCGFTLGSFPVYLSIFNNDGAFWKFISNEDGCSIDIAYGFAGVMYHRKMFPFSTPPPEIFENEGVFHSDDVYLSAVASSQGYHKKAFSYPRGTIQLTNDGLSNNTGKFIMRMLDAIVWCRNRGMFKAVASASPINSLTGLLLILLILAIVILYAFN